MRNICAATRVVVVGIDGFSPLYMDRFLAEGKLPALCDLVSRGVRIPMVSTLPATTPVAWATVATGSPPSETGIEGFLLHRPGEKLDQRRSGCYSNRCKSQFLWEAATLAGRRSYLVKFPLSYPSDTATFRLDGAAGWGGLKCMHEASSSSISSTLPSHSQIPILTSYAPWSSEESCGGRIFFRGIWEMPSLWGKANPVLYICMTHEHTGRVRVHVADAPHWHRRLTSLCEGEWSEPLTIEASGRRSLGDYSFRLKVLFCSESPPNLRILNTALHERTGHSIPTSIWEKHLSVTGPIEEQTEPSLVFTAGLDIQTQLEIFRLNTEWLERISSQLLNHEQWNLLMVHTHIVDWAHHLLHGAIDPGHPNFKPHTARFYEQALLQAYQMADQLVATVIEHIDLETDLVVLGDHGQDLLHTTFRTNEWLAEKKLLSWADDGCEIDWDHTQACAAGNYVYINMKGREPTGIVPPTKATDLKQRLVQDLRSLRDDRTGLAPVLVSGGKEAFRDLGGDGVGVGDVVFCMRSGFQATNGRGKVLSNTIPLQEFTSGHDHFWPLDPALHTRLFAAGPSFRKGYRHVKPGHLTDVAPTLSTLLGIKPPVHSRGRALSELFSKLSFDTAAGNITQQEKYANETLG